ncbi:hypothetical protein ACSBOB_19595 [Mesorhizobium sp. ASY16-5R]|uniref:hypothetical protein n=1 Tax=Mesorhizobium sp. ASY16-5R TaxID=3445772 RepID=UPI003F9FC83D
MKLPIQTSRVIESVLPDDPSLDGLRANIENEIKKAIAPLFANIAPAQRGNAAVSTAAPPKGLAAYKLPSAGDDRAQLVNRAQSHGYRLPKAED